MIPVPEDKIPDIIRYIPRVIDGLDIYEFGVLYGNTLTQILEGFRVCNKSIHSIFGFDSFQGLPEEDEKIKFFSDWKPGMFSAKEALQTNNIDYIYHVIYQRINIYGIPLFLIPGWYKDLQDDLVITHGMGPAAYINIDCDLYISAYQALDFVFRNKLAIAGTIIRFDDYNSTPEFLGGESLAFKEISEKYNVKHDKFPNSSVFIITKI